MIENLDSYSLFSLLLHYFGVTDSSSDSSYEFNMLVIQGLVKKDINSTYYVLTKKGEEIIERLSDSDKLHLILYYQSNIVRLVRKYKMVEDFVVNLDKSCLSTFLANENSIIRQSALWIFNYSKEMI